jgi:hypothetical protein
MAVKNLHTETHTMTNEVAHERFLPIILYRFGACAVC